MQDVANPFKLSSFVCRVFLSSLTLSNTSSFLTWSAQLIFSILFQHHISKLSRYFWPILQSVQASAPYKAILQMQNFPCYRVQINVEKTKVMRNSRQPSVVQILLDKKQLQSVEYFNYLGSMITNDARCTWEIKSRISMANAAFNKKKTLFISKLGLNLRKKLVKCQKCVCKKKYC